MIAKVKVYPEGVDLTEQMRMLGTDAALGMDKPFFSLTLDGCGAYAPLYEAVAMGLTPEDIKAASEEPQEFVITLKRKES